MQGEQGLFVAMPSRKMRNEEFKDIVHPICPELRNDITKVVQEKYFSLDQEQEAVVQKFSIKLQGKYCLENFNYMRILSQIQLTSF